MRCRNHVDKREKYEQTVHIERVRLRELDLQVSVAYLMCSPLQVLMKSWTWEKSVSKSGAFGMENFTNLTGRKSRVQTIRRLLCNIKNILKKTFVMLDLNENVQLHILKRIQLATLDFDIKKYISIHLAF